MFLQTKGPLSCRLPDKLTPDDKIIITGKTSQTFGSFSVNLSPYSIIDEECVLHFNPRFRFNAKCTDGLVVLNHKKNSKWQTEERWLNMPFNTNQPFVIEIKVTKSAYEISVKQTEKDEKPPYYAFNHRVDMYKANFIFINGDVSIGCIQYFNSDKISPEVSQPPPSLDTLHSHVYSQRTHSPRKSTVTGHTPLTSLQLLDTLHSQVYSNWTHSTHKSTVTGQTPLTSLQSLDTLHSQVYSHWTHFTHKSTVTGRTSLTSLQSLDTLHSQVYSNWTHSTHKSTVTGQTPLTSLQSLDTLHSQVYSHWTHFTHKSTVTGHTPLTSLQSLDKLHSQVYSHWTHSTHKSTVTGHTSLTSLQSLDTPLTSLQSLDTLHSQVYSHWTHSIHAQIPALFLYFWI
ncbi:grifin [Biomphalaria pfeifferi]|uniref:Galectin n=1 Tax=Biomphalaria pfeifferi TaxID=112525 RepID=A0AAD8AXQ6_BIOPF|nr:grifin [Biomphalaria pfeifferi]